MRADLVSLSEVRVDPALSRARYPKVFEEHLRASIDAIGLIEPIKLARSPDGSTVVVDGVMRVRAMRALREADPSRFENVNAYLYPYEDRFEIRYQSDIYQDLLPSQLARLVEHLHVTEDVPKSEIARYIGVSPATLRNYTGLWRMLERGGLFATAVDLMDLGVFPSSNPYAWLRLNDRGATQAFALLAHRSSTDDWVLSLVERARRGNPRRLSIAEIERATSALPRSCYRGGVEMRDAKRKIGQRRGTNSAQRSTSDPTVAQLKRLKSNANSEVVTIAVESMLSTLK